MPQWNKRTFWIEWQRNQIIVKKKIIILHQESRKLGQHVANKARLPRNVHRGSTSHSRHRQAIVFPCFPPRSCNDGILFNEKHLHLATSEWMRRLIQPFIGIQFCFFCLFFFKKDPGIIQLKPSQRPQFKTVFQHFVSVKPLDVFKETPGQFQPCLWLRDRVFRTIRRNEC